MNLFSKRFIKDISSLLPAMILALFSISCFPEIKEKDNTENGLKIIDEFKIVFPHLNLDDSWEPNIETKPNEEYFLQLEKKDSLAQFNNIWLNKRIVITEGISDVSSDVCYSISNIFYYWFDGKKGRMIEYNDRLDTLWEYKHIGEITDLNQEIFIKGKYQYLYKNNLLTPKQKKYFEIHRDSLRKVEGNNLPQLPEFLD